MYACANRIFKFYVKFVSRGLTHCYACDKCAMKIKRKKDKMMDTSYKFSRGKCAWKAGIERQKGGPLHG